MSRREPTGSRSPSSSRPGSARAGARGPRPRSDGKVDISCPQCAAQFRVGEDNLDQKIECTECHRVFFAKTTVGKRPKPPDNTKAYVGFGVGAVVLIALFVMMSSGDKPVVKPPAVFTPSAPAFSPGTHPRTLEIFKWAKAIGEPNLFVIKSHSDLGAVASVLELTDASDDGALLTAISTHVSLRYLRELDPISATLMNEEAMTAASGQAIVYIMPKPGTDDYKANTRGEIEVSFRMDGEQVKVTGWKVKLKPLRAKQDPTLLTFVPNKDIAKPDLVEVSDTAGTRKVSESQPAAVPHWSQATDEQRAKADKVVADLILSADPESPGTLFNKARMAVVSVDDRKAVVPRALNAMYELYGDVNGNNLKLSQLDRALRGWSGFAVNYDPADSGDAAKDKKARESCVRQWFAFWYRYSSGQLDEFIDTRDNLEEPIDDGKNKKKPGK